MKPKIEHPHIFISYAWGSIEHQDNVVQFAKSLVENGVDVELDKWSLKEGNDTYAFMEQMVNNPEITNVLLLLDKTYAEKANGREGGVGTETQIISPEIYTKVKQEKFIPIVFERGENGEIYKPTFLNGLLHFDLSVEETYYSEFQRLVKRLFGIEILEKPALGNPPDWLNQKAKLVNPKMEFPKIFSAGSLKEKKYEISIAFKMIKDQMFKTISEFELNEENYLNSYKNAQEYRNKIIAIIDSCIWEDFLVKEVASFFETAKNEQIENGLNNELKDTLIHESFVYSVALLFKKKNYDSLAYLLNKTFFSSLRFEGPTSFNLFYQNNQSLDNIVSHRDNKKYYCGTAQLWMETINMDFISKSDFVAADNLLYNVAVFGKNYNYHWWWFPVSYVYDERNLIIEELGKKMVSREHLKEVSKIFGYDNPNDFIAEAKTIVEDVNNNRQRWRYSGSWHDAPLITDYFKFEEAGALN